MKKDLSNTLLGGTVLSPNQLVEELAGSLQPPQYGRHAVMTSIPNAVAQLFESATRQHAAMSLHPSPAGRSCALLRIQAGPALLRVLVALGTPTACDWLVEGLQQQSFLLALDVEETKRLVVIQARVATSPSAMTFAQSAKAQAPWDTSTPDARADLLADLRRVGQGLLLSKPQSVLAGVKLEMSYVAFAGEVAMPNLPTRDDETRH